MIHACHHWFWITISTYEVIGLVLALQVAALTPPDVTSPAGSVSAPSERKQSPQANSTIQPNAIHGPNERFDSDLDDTYNGENADIIPPYPVKKYHSKYTDHPNNKKYKSKSKAGENSDKVINIVAEEYEVSINRLLSSSVSPPTTVTLDLNTTESVANVTEEALSDEPSENNTTNEHPIAENVTSSSIDLTTLEPFELEGKMAVAAATSVDHEVLAPSGLDAGSITGITLGIVVISGLLGAISFVLYRRRYLNKPQVLNDKSSTLDSSGYIDDTSLRENSEEMYSLDNDSFLNSLEAMTIQNYWTENVKHTKL